LALQTGLRLATRFLHGFFADDIEGYEVKNMKGESTRSEM